MEKSNSGGGNWEAEHAIGAYDDLIINTKEETLTITMFELLKIEQALEHQHSSNFESDYEMLQEEIKKSECDWDWAAHLCLKMKEADDDKNYPFYYVFNFEHENILIRVFFDKVSLDLMGWETKDIYQNLIQTFLSDININIDVDEKIFSIQKYTN